MMRDEMRSKHLAGDGTVNLSVMCPDCGAEGHLTSVFSEAGWFLDNPEMDGEPEEDIKEDALIELSEVAWQAMHAAMIFVLPNKDGVREFEMWHGSKTVVRIEVKGGVK